MNPDHPIGFIATAGEWMLYYERVMEAEKAMGPLTLDEKRIIASTIGREITVDELTNLLQGKKVLRLTHDPKGDKNETSD